MCKIFKEIKRRLSKRRLCKNANIVDGWDNGVGKVHYSLIHDKYYISYEAEDYGSWESEYFSNMDLAKKELQEYCKKIRDIKEGKKKEEGTKTMSKKERSKEEDIKVLDIVYYISDKRIINEALIEISKEEYIKRSIESNQVED